MFIKAHAALATRLGELRTREEGQGMVEYALILVLVSVAAILALDAIGSSVDLVFDDVDENLALPAAG